MPVVNLLELVLLLFLCVSGCNFKSIAIACTLYLYFAFDSKMYKQLIMAINVGWNIFAIISSCEMTIITLTVDRVKCKEQTYAGESKLNSSPSTTFHSIGSIDDKKNSEFLYLNKCTLKHSHDRFDKKKV